MPFRVHAAGPRFLDGHRCIDDDGRPKAVVGEIPDESRRVREALDVPGEGAIAIHVVDVEVDRVRGDRVCAQPVGHGSRLGVRCVTPAGLVVAQRPSRRHRRPSDEVREPGQDIRRRRPIDDVPIERVRLGRHGERRTMRIGQVEDAPVCRLDEKAVRRAVGVEGEVERDGDIQHVRAVVLTTPFVRRPARMATATPFQRPGPLTEAEVATPVGHALPPAHPLRFRGDTRIGDQPPRTGRDRESPVGRVDRRRQARRRDGRAVAAFPDLDMDRRVRVVRFRHRPRSTRHPPPVLGGPDVHHPRRQRRDRDARIRQIHDHAPAVTLGSAHGLQDAG